MHIIIKRLVIHLGLFEKYCCLDSAVMKGLDGVSRDYNLGLILPRTL
jgi:hypothetical protein